MARELNQWIQDAEAFEILKSYNVNRQKSFEFQGSVEQGDFYIALLNKMFFTLRKSSGDLTRQEKESLLLVAKGLILYSQDKTKSFFEGVDVTENMLYVASIYYLCDYKAISAILVGRLGEKEFDNDSSVLLYRILSGKLKHIRNYTYDDWLNDFIESGRQERLEEIHSILAGKVKNDCFDSLNDFFDTYIACKVLEKFQKENIWKSLVQYGGIDFWKEYVDYSAGNGIISLLPSQQSAIDSGLLEFSRSFSLHMPTSAGKTYITETVIYQELKTKRNARILYLAPLRSLSRELRERFSVMASSLGFRVHTVYGGSLPTVEEDSLSNAQLLITTPETFAAIEEGHFDLIDDFSLVICDEGQLLDEIGRGVDYELLLTRLKANQNVRFLFISAIIPNISQINVWLGGEAVEVGESDYRPCKIRLALARRDGKNSVLDCTDEQISDFKVQIEQFLSESQMCKLGCSQRDYSCGLALKAMEGGSVMLYCSMKDGSRGCIAHAEKLHDLIKTSEFPSPLSYVTDAGKRKLSEVVEYLAYQLGNEYPLTQYVRQGFAYHHGQLPQDLRELVESLYTSKALGLICCTSTLAEGINMPVKTIVLANITDTQDYWHSLGVKELKNIIGRAGRAGRENYGMVLVPYNGNEEPIRKIVNAILSVNIDNFHGTLYKIAQDVLTLGITEESDINALLDSKNCSAPIDRMISLKIEGDVVSDINIEEVIHDSLAYHLGNDDIRGCLEKLFSARCSLLERHFGTGGYGAFKNTGLQLSEFDELKSLLTEESVSEIISNDICSENFISSMVSLMFKLQSVQYDVSQLGHTKPLKKVLTDLNLVSILLKRWIDGLQYVEMQNGVDCDTKQAALFVDYVQRSLVYKAKSVLSFITTQFGIENSNLSFWPEYMNRGVHSPLALCLLERGLGDRIAANILSDEYNGEYESLEDEKMVADIIVKDKRARTLIEKNSIPSISKRKFSIFIK